MKKTKKTIVTLLAALTLSSGLATAAVNTNADSKQQITTANKNEKLTWTYPFVRQDKRGVRPMYNAQIFGKTNYLRSLKPKSYFHDGWDFGWGEVGHSTVRAIHPGIVQKVAYGNGLGWFVWVVSPDNYVAIYQEGFKHKKDIKVKAGQKVKTGQKIGRLTGSHLHLGLTKTNLDYINQYGYPCNNWYKNNGTWLNPVKTIKQNLKK